MATTIENLIVRSVTYHALVETFETFSVEEITVFNPESDGHQVEEIAFHKDAILIMVKPGTSLFIPHDETYLKTGDILNIMGTDSALENAREKLQVIVRKIISCLIFIQIFLKSYSYCPL